MRDAMGVGIGLPKQTITWFIPQSMKSMLRQRGKLVSLLASVATADVGMIRSSAKGQGLRVLDMPNSV